MSIFITGGAGFVGTNLQGFLGNKFARMMASPPRESASSTSTSITLLTATYCIAIVVKTFLQQGLLNQARTRSD